MATPEGICVLLVDTVERFGWFYIPADSVQAQQNNAAILWPEKRALKDELLG